MTMSGNLVLKVTGRYPSKFKNLWYCLVPGTDKIFKDGYRWIPGYENLKTQRQENRVFFFILLSIIYWYDYPTKQTFARFKDLIIFYLA